MAGVKRSRLERNDFWRWAIAVTAWFVSSVWALMYWNFEGGHLYHLNHGGPIAACVAGVLCVLTTFYVVRTFLVLTSRKRP